MSLKTRTVVVTGASSGIGLAIVNKLLQQRARVIGLSRRCLQVTPAAENYTPLSMDLSVLATLPAQLTKLQHDFPDIDAMIFVAGVGQFGSLEEFSYSQIERLMTLNFTSPVFCCRALLPFLKRKSRSDLIFIGSEAALQGKRKGAVYCASKFALRGFTQALREECASSGVRVCLINPGMVKTPFFDNLGFEPGKGEMEHLLPEDVAEAVSYVLNSRQQMVIDEINLNPLNKVVCFKK